MTARRCDLLRVGPFVKILLRYTQRTLRLAENAEVAALSPGLGDRGDTEMIRIRGSGNGAVNGTYSAASATPAISAFLRLGAG
jgi:hypothetical protein